MVMITDKSIGTVGRCDPALHYVDPCDVCKDPKCNRDEECEFEKEAG